jgi:hypothetical protein
MTNALRNRDFRGRQTRPHGDAALRLGAGTGRWGAKNKTCRT